jgi:hypothetical protein
VPPLRLTMRRIKMCMSIKKVCESPPGQSSFVLEFNDYGGYMWLPLLKFIAWKGFDPNGTIRNISAPVLPKKWRKRDDNVDEAWGTWKDIPLIVSIAKERRKEELVPVLSQQLQTNQTTSSFGITLCRKIRSTMPQLGRRWTFKHPRKISGDGACSRRLMRQVRRLYKD